MIDVINQGTIDATNVEVTDFIPAGLTLDDDAWTVVGGNATRIITSIPAGQTEPVSITFVINENATNSNLTNLAEISEDNNDDTDSTPDGIPDNDG